MISCMYINNLVDNIEKENEKTQRKEGRQRTLKTTLPYARATWPRKMRRNKNCCVKARVHV